MGDITGCLIFWVAAFLALAVAEAITVRLIAIWFAVGSIGAFVMALMDTPFWLQAVVFVLCSLLLLLLTRPFTKSFINKKYETTSAECVVGKTAVVIEEIDNGRAQGRVTVCGADWAARSSDDSVINAGEEVTVESVDGVKVMVSKLLPKKLPGGAV